MKKILSMILILAMLMVTACQKQSPVSEQFSPEEVMSTPTAEAIGTEAPMVTEEPKATDVPASAVEPEKGTIQVFKQSTDTIAKNQELWDNREFAVRQMEQLDRGLIAVKTDGGIFVSWRWLGDESGTVKYNLYRDGQRVNAFPLNVTNYIDTNGKLENTYQVAAVVDGVEQDKCVAVTVWENNYLEIPLVDKPKAYHVDGKEIPSITYKPMETSIADLDGDNQFEIVLKWEPDNRQDNANNGKTSPTILDAYKLDGTFMWRINLGKNIRSGSHYTQFMVYDLDGDGKAEIVCKTADGTTDNEGNVIGDADKSWVDGYGRILSGPEYLTVFDGERGTIIDTIEYEPGRGDVTSWGDNYGNRCDRFLACVAYLNGSTPSVVMCRGYYTRACLVAYDLVDGELQKVWEFDSDEGYGEYKGQGNHSIAVADVDMDGKDEIVYGAAVIDDDGTGLYATGLGHGDAQHTGDLIPDRPGLEIFSVHEEKSASFGLEMRDAMTGEILWGSYEGSDVGRGVSGDIDPNYPGAESWAAYKMVSSTGELIAESPSISQNFVIYWDGDLGSEVQDSNHIDEWVSEKNMTQLLFSNKEYVSNNGTKATPGITCDLFGDWREETILFKRDSTSMAIFTTTIPTDYKIYTLMHDLQYRTYIATQNVGYNQPPHTGYYLGFDTTVIPVSRVTWTENGESIVNPDLVAGQKYYEIDDLMRDESVALKVGGLNALVNDLMQRVDSVDNVIAPFYSDGLVYVPLSFIGEALNVEVEGIDDGSCKIGGKVNISGAFTEIKNGKVCVPIGIVKELGYHVIVDKDGFVYISKHIADMDADAKNILLNALDNYVQPENDTADKPISKEELSEKQVPVYAVDATTHDGNLPEGAVDGDFDTRWNGWDDGATLTLDLGQVVDVVAVAAAFYKGYERNYYFDIEVSIDGESWTTVLKDQSSPITSDKELTMFSFPETVQAKYLRYIGHESSVNNSNNIWEFMVLAP